MGPPSILAQETWKTYTSNKHSLTIDYPSTATVTEGRTSPYDPDKDLAIDDVKHSGILVYVTESPDVLPFQLEMLSNDVFDTQLMNNYDYDSYDIPIVNPHEVTINNQTYYTYTISNIDEKTDKSKSVHQSYFTVHPTKGWIISFLMFMSPEDANSTESIRNHILSSIKFFD